MPQYPLYFDVTSKAQPGIQNPWTAGTAEAQTQLAVPSSFAGPGGALSPEDLYALALTNCFVGTFKVIAENSKFSFEALQVNARLTMEPDESKKPVMKKIDMQIQITEPSSTDKAELLVRKTMQGGFILNSVKTEITYTLNLGD